MKTLVFILLFTLWWPAAESHSQGTSLEYEGAYLTTKDEHDILLMVQKDQTILLFLNTKTGSWATFNGYLERGVSGFTSYLQQDEIRMHIIEKANGTYYWQGLDVYFHKQSEYPQEGLLKLAEHTRAPDKFIEGMLRDIESR